MKDKKDLFSFLRDKKLLRDVSSVITFVLSFLLAFVSNGFIRGFDADVLFTIAVGFGALGIYVSVKMVTLNMTERAEVEAEENNQEIIDLKEKINKAMAKLDRRYARKALKNYNIERINDLREEKYNNKVNKYNDIILSSTDKIENITIISVRWWRLIKKLFRYLRLRRLNKKLNKAKSKLKKTKLETIYVKYDFIELDDLTVKDTSSGNNDMTEKDKFKATPAKQVRKKKSRTDLIKVLFYVGFNGAVIASLAGIDELLIFAVSIILTLSFTAVTSYFLTTQYANNVYVGFLNDKYNLIETIQEDAAKIRLEEEPQEQEQEETVEPHKEESLQENPFNRKELLEGV